MAKKRTYNKNHSAVLKEFGNLCSVCRGEGPEVHHIDEDNSNHEISNLLPLCPNFHRVTQHNPYKKIEPRRLKLFRIFKEPKVLTTQFKPIYLRLTFLDELSENSDAKVISNHASDLINFISHLEMGSYFSKKLNSFLERKILAASVFIASGDKSMSAFPSKNYQEESDKNYIRNIILYRNDIYDLIIKQLLQYQNWEDHINHLCGQKK